MSRNLKLYLYLSTFQIFLIYYLIIYIIMITLLQSTLLSFYISYHYVYINIHVYIIYIIIISFYYIRELHFILFFYLHFTNSTKFSSTSPYSHLSLNILQGMCLAVFHLISLAFGFGFRTASMAIAKTKAQQNDFNS